MSVSVHIEASPGEVIDKITILQIKQQRFTDPRKRDHVEHELKVLEEALARVTEFDDATQALADELRSVNETLWEVEDTLRVCEAAQRFDDRFVELARSVYRWNDRRCALKRAINERLGSAILEEKQYVDYQAGDQEAAP